MEENNVTLSQELQIEKERRISQFECTAVGQMLRQFEAQQRMAKIFAESTIVPDSYKNNIGNCIIAIDMSMRMNANPLMIMQNLNIVKGNVGWSSTFLISCINKCGRYTSLEYDIKQDGFVGQIQYNETVWDPQAHRNTYRATTFNGDKIPNYTCIAYATDIKTGEVKRSTPVSIKMAVLEGWYTKSGSKWPNIPQQMLVYRTAAFFERAHCPEIGMGFHTIDEIQDAVIIDEPVRAKKKLIDAALNAAESSETDVHQQTETSSSPETSHEQPTNSNPQTQQPSQESKLRKTLL